MVDVVHRTAEQVFIPFTVGGGIRTVDDARRMLRAGADKVSVNTAAVAAARADHRDRRRVRRAVRACARSTPSGAPAGSGSRCSCTAAARRRASTRVEWAREAARLGAGEILLTSMDRDGTRDGFDLELTRAVADAVGVPVIASGGVGTLRAPRRRGRRGRRRRRAGGVDLPLRRAHRRRGQGAMAAGGHHRPAGRLTNVIGRSRSTSGCANRRRQDGVPPTRAHAASRCRCSRFGSWVTFDNQLKDDLAMECMQTATTPACNFFDNAEAYAGGESEAIMGRVIASSGWRRSTLRASARSSSGAIERRCRTCSNTLNRKYLIARDRRLARADRASTSSTSSDCHRADPAHADRGDGVGDAATSSSSGKALYWGTSEWTADEIRAASGDRRAPPPAQAGGGAAAVQPARPRQVETEYARLYDDIGLGTTIWSPLASAAHRQVPDGIPPTPWRLTATSGSQRLSTEALAKSTAARSPTSSAARWPSSIAWCAANPTCRP